MEIKLVLRNSSLDCPGLPLPVVDIYQNGTCLATIYQSGNVRFDENANLDMENVVAPEFVEFLIKTLQNTI